MLIGSNGLTAALCDWQQSAAIGSSLPIMVTKRSGKIECKRVVKWSAVFQLVLQPKIKKDINFINQYLTDQIQISPAPNEATPPKKIIQIPVFFTF